MNSLEKIIKKYKGIEYNQNNYSVGGGLTENGKFASIRHEEATKDKGKLTFGKATQMFKKATAEDTTTIKEIIRIAVPNMEWHHAGRMPKRFGGGMKKTYFLNSDQIVYIAENFEYLKNKID
jgi:hypothetical protein